MNRLASPRYVLMTAQFHALLREPPADCPIAEEHPDGFDPLPVHVLVRRSAPPLTAPVHDQKRASFPAGVRNAG